MSNAYQNFVDSYLNATSWPQRKDGVPIELLDELNDEEKSRAENELIMRLSSWRDSWPIEGLGHLRSKNALPHLKRILGKARGSMKAKIATAIWKICGDPQMLDVVVDCSYPSIISSLSPYQTYSQIDIIYCLSEFDDTRAIDRLKELQHDTDYLISCNANRALSQIKARKQNSRILNTN